MLYIYRQLRNADPADDASAREVINNLFFSEKRYDLGDVAEPCTGIGLHNLDSRWQLITGHGIRIDRSGEIFSVCMSLLKPRTK